MYHSRVNVRVNMKFSKYKVLPKSQTSLKMGAQGQPQDYENCHRIFKCRYLRLTHRLCGPIIDGFYVCLNHDCYTVESMEKQLILSMSQMSDTDQSIGWPTGPYTSPLASCSAFRDHILRVHLAKLEIITRHIRLKSSSICCCQLI